MNVAIGRRRFLQVAAAGATAIGLRPAAFAAGTEKLGWRLACAAYSFNKLSLVETIDQVKRLGLTEIEGFTWQRLKPDAPKLLTNEKLPEADRKELRTRLDDAGMRLVSTYCQKLEEPDATRRTFELAKSLGMEFLVAEPPESAYDMIERLCDEYQISLAVHNHPQPSPYWSPDVLAARAKGRSKRIGACADTGHWCRSGLDPAEALRKLEGRVVSFHLKDVNTFGDLKAECVPWGSGLGRLDAILAEAKRQGFRGVFAIEYEPYHPENFAKIAECVAWFRRAADRLA